MEILDESAFSLWLKYQQTAGESDAAERFQEQVNRGSPNYFPVMFPIPVLASEFVENTAAAGEKLLQLIAAIPSRCFGGDYAAWMRAQGLSREEIDFFKPQCSQTFVDRALQFVRPDFLVARNGIKAVEVNIGVPIGGMVQCDRIADEYQKTPFASFLAEHGMHFYSPRTTEIWSRAVRRLARVSSLIESPLLFEAHADPKIVAKPTPAHKDFISAVERMGFRHRFGLITELEFTQSGVVHHGDVVHCVFTPFTYAEYRANGHAPDHVLRLCQHDLDGHVDYIAPLVNAIFDSKCNFEILTGAEFRSKCSPDEVAFLDRVVPRTIRLSEATLAEAMSNKDDFVLKPGGQFGGGGVVIGSEVSTSHWQQALKRALTNEEPHVLQETVQPLWTYDGRLPNGLGFGSHCICISPMYFGARYAGSLIRNMPIEGNRVPIINVAQGARMGTVVVAQIRGADSVEH